MTNETAEELALLVRRSFEEKNRRNIELVKDFCLYHFNEQLTSLQQKLLHSQCPYYEKEILLVNDEIEIIVSGWLPGNTCYPHDHDQAACFVLVLNGNVENTLLSFSNDSLELVSKTTKTSGDYLYLAEGIIHYMQNTGEDDLICLHVYTPGISEMKVFDEQNRKIYTLSGEAAAWLPAREDHVLEISSFSEKKLERLAS